MTRFRSALFIALCSIVGFIGAELVASRRANAIKPNACLSCISSTCSGEGWEDVGAGPDVTRCMENDNIPPAHCCTVTTRAARMPSGAICFFYRCNAAIWSGGASCVYSPEP